MDKLPRSGMSEITTKDGKRHAVRIDYPKGDPKNSMSDGELEEKFTSMASKFMSAEQMERATETIYQLETLDNIGDLMRQLIFEGRG
jgi:2-methylcitrate dehydratase